VTTLAEVDTSELTQVEPQQAHETPNWLVIVGELGEDGETATAPPAIPSARVEATVVERGERRTSHRDSAEKSLEHLYSIRARLLDIEDAGGLDERSAARLIDVESEISAIQKARAARLRETDPGWARLEELARQVLAAAEPVTSDSQ
jgi:hypothetical protein